MIPVCFDTETFLIQPGEGAPPPVCLQWTTDPAGAEPKLLHCNRRMAAKHIREAPDTIDGWLEDPNALLVGHHIPFDLAVIAAQWPDFIGPIFRAYAADRVTDTRHRQRLIDIGQGIARGDDGDAYLVRDGKHIKVIYNLAFTAERHSEIVLDKSDPWRLKYGTLYNTPVEQWPADALSYALNDATATMLAFQGQEREGGPYLEDQFRQNRAAWWIHLMATWGIKTDRATVREYELEVLEENEKDKGHLVSEGLVRWNGTKDTKKAQAAMLAAMLKLGEAPVITDAGLKVLGARRNDDIPLADAVAYGQANPKHLSLNKDSCDLSGDETLMAYARFTSSSTTLTRVRRLYKGADATPIQSYFDPLKNTGRTSCSMSDTRKGQTPPMWGFQLQNPPRGGRIRECFLARPGYLFWNSDYSGMELCTWSQVCLWALGFSKMAEALNNGQDPHTMVASNIIGKPYDWCMEARKGLHGPEAEAQMDKARQSGKIVNFGYPGGMGPRTLKVQARTQYKVNLTDDEAYWLRDVWRDTWPEAKEYFKWITNLKPGGMEKWTIKHFRSERIRSNINYTVACNSFFQGLAADAAKAAGFEIAREMYTARESPLFGSRLVNFVHDEFMGEVPIATASAAALRGDTIMKEVAQQWVPDVTIRTEPTLTARWYKNAKTVMENGRLVEWKP